MRTLWVNGYGMKSQQRLLVVYLIPGCVLEKGQVGIWELFRAARCLRFEIWEVWKGNAPSCHPVILIVLVYVCTIFQGATKYTILSQHFPTLVYQDWNMHAVRMFVIWPCPQQTRLSLSLVPILQAPASPLEPHSKSKTYVLRS